MAVCGSVAIIFEAQPWPEGSCSVPCNGETQWCFPGHHCSFAWGAEDHWLQQWRMERWGLAIFTSQVAMRFSNKSRSHGTRADLMKSVGGTEWMGVQGKAQYGCFPLLCGTAAPVASGFPLWSHLGGPVCRYTCVCGGGDAACSIATNRGFIKAAPCHSGYPLDAVNWQTIQRW